jgi:hypothetical protein
MNNKSIVAWYIAREINAVYEFELGGNFVQLRSKINKHYLALLA